MPDWLDVLADELERRLRVLQVRSGSVMQVTPDVQVRFDGDTADTTIQQGRVGMTLATGDRVVLLKVGAQWQIAYQFTSL